MPKLFALLVGINAYPPQVPSLEGCLNDNANVEDYLRETVPEAAILVLKDQEATRDNVIDQFRRHLGQAGKDDVVLFQYCGHGANSTAAPEFRALDASGKDQGLVLYDSRLDNDHFDLADKELARLVQEVAANEPHFAMILDCCHSGSGTRDFEDRREKVRSTDGKPYVRPLETYLGGYYAGLRQQQQVLAVPVGRHMLLAACDRSQTAKEDLDTHRGIFTTNLIEVLRKSREPLSYADLFVRSRAAVRRYILDHDKSAQDPQFEALGNFDAYAGFLGAAAAGGRRSYSVYRDADSWRVDCGALEGLSTDPALPVKLALYPEADGGQPAGVATTVRVGAQTSDVALDFESDPAARYRAEIISLPAPPLAVGFRGEATIGSALEAALAADATANVVLVEPGTDDGYRLAQDAGELGLESRNGTEPRRVAVGDTAGAVRLLKHVARWHRTLALDNRKPKIDPSLVDFVFAEAVEGGEDHIHQGPELTVESRQVDGKWQKVRGRLELRNRSSQRLSFLLLHFSGDYGVQVMANDEIAPGGEWMAMTVGTSQPSPIVNFTVDGDADSTLERLKLVVSTERVDDFRLELEPLAGDRGFGSESELDEEAAKPASDDWFAKDLRVTVVRHSDPPGGTASGPGAIQAPAAAANAAAFSAAGPAPIS
jgi:hypothetical protein